MKVGIFLIGECVKTYDYADVLEAYEDAKAMTEETDLIHEVKVIYG
ncbi:hypothetical protein [Bacillus nitratireducens]|nr:hypothetical protein [Bacillus nitratireducens]